LAEIIDPEPAAFFLFNRKKLIVLACFVFESKDDSFEDL